VPLHPPLPPVPSSAPLPSTLDGKARGTVIPVKSGPETPGGSTPLTSLSPTDPMPNPSLPVLTPHSPFNQGIQPVTVRTPPLPRLPLPCRCP
jgi:hypothetical protein